MIRTNRQDCNHTFEVLKVFDSGEELMQLLQCKYCKHKFWGFGGYENKPKYIHKISQKPNLLI